MKTPKASPQTNSKVDPTKSALRSFSTPCAHIFAAVGLALVCMINIVSGLTYNEFMTYSIINEKIKVTSFFAGVGGDFVIPSAIGYYPVTSIGAFAFKNSALTTVTIPASITSIEDWAFETCYNLQNVIFLGNAPTMGQGAFSQSSGNSYYLDGKLGFTTPVWLGRLTYPGVPPQFNSLPPPAGKVDTAYDHYFFASGTPAPIFTVTAGALPDGLTINYRSSRISGTPLTAGIFTGTITASNGFTPDATQDFSIDTNEYRSLVVIGNNGSATGGGTYLINSIAALNATPSPGYLFSEWTGDASGADNPLSVVVIVDKTITANFTPDINDTDDDGLTNYQEIVEYGTNPILQDTDSDGVKDSKDAFPLDPAETLDSDRDGIGDIADTDDDGDGLSDVDEINTYATNPKRADSDGDGLSDPSELQTHLTNPNLADSDNDGLSDGSEVNTYGTLPKVGDTDGDGFLDGYEVFTGHLPLISTDRPALVAEARTAIEFTFPSALGKTYQIEDSLDMTGWSPVETGIAGNGAVITRFYTTRNQQKRFFRVEEGVTP